MSKILSLTGAQVEALKSLLKLSHQLDDQQALTLGQVVEKLEKPDKKQSVPEFYNSNVDAEADAKLIP